MNEDEPCPERLGNRYLPRKASRRPSSSSCTPPKALSRSSSGPVKVANIDHMSDRHAGCNGSLRLTIASCFPSAPVVPWLTRVTASNPFFVTCFWKVSRRGSNPFTRNNSFHILARSERPKMNPISVDRISAGTEYAHLPVDRHLGARRTLPASEPDGP